jgi:hypothetical protein
MWPYTTASTATAIRIASPFFLYTPSLTRDTFGPGTKPHFLAGKRGGFVRTVLVWPFWFYLQVWHSLA